MKVCSFTKTLNQLKNRYPDIDEETYIFLHLNIDNYLKMYESGKMTFEECCQFIGAVYSIHRSEEIINNLRG